MRTVRKSKNWTRRHPIRRKSGPARGLSITPRSVVPELTRNASIQLTKRFSLRSSAGRIRSTHRTLPDVRGSQWRSRQAIIFRLAALFFTTRILRKMPKGWSFKDDRRVIELARSSKTLEQIAKTMDRSPDRIRKVAMRLGFSIKAQATTKK